MTSAYKKPHPVEVDRTLPGVYRTSRPWEIGEIGDEMNKSLN